MAVPQTLVSLISAKKQIRYVFIQFKPIHIHIHPFKSTIHIASTFHLFN